MAGSLLQNFAASFLHQLHLRSFSQSGNLLLKDALDRVQRRLASYVRAPEGQAQEERRVAERLVQALYMHRVLLCNSAASFYVKILQTLWQFEDEGILMKSSLINDVAIRALLEAYRTKTCGPAVGAALHSMFVTSSPENKGVVGKKISVLRNTACVFLVLLKLYSSNTLTSVEAVLRGICLQNDDLLPLWEEAIMSGIGRSVLRLGVVEHALLNMAMLLLHSLLLRILCSFAAGITSH